MTNLEDKDWSRTEGDSWDIVSSVGFTALGVAAARAIENAHAEPLVRDTYAEHFVRAAGEPNLIALLDNPEAQGTNPTTALRQIGLRSKFFDEFFVSATNSGCTQAVILAAGLDVRAHRLPWPEGTKVFELDQPQVLEFKDRVLAEHGATPTSDRREIAVDLRDDWPAALLAAGFDPEAPTAWSAEGLIIYLPSAAQDLLFERVVALSAPGSQIAVEALRGRPDFSKWGEVQKKYADEDHPMSKVDISSLFYDEERADVQEWLAARGWTVQGADALQLAAAYGVEVPELPQEIVELTKQGNYLTAVRPG
ncbi:class I SAM-dependent methyltransferase [Mycobacterium sp. CBMA271]|uniref:class I SAM-dependent methyltransferase n=1 Tax=unclassified Mycobacteroides TaxID=2618759 RepID=UPI0012DF167E|nr:MULTISPECIES: class I SAM-dependent methyltransferase [unclassified Mycobacteroides]MUM19174.1 SAM-dependent methyltransferase [Mycobacteroides sp. CBMA 326]MUM21588.1 class I SAM-dependent methyltransferase [Mycobacteroides sp. CBMA 271]